MPSRSANSIHVARMCEAFVLLGHDVALVFRRSISENFNLKVNLESYYGVKLGNARLLSFFNSWEKAINIQIAFIALCEILINSCLRKNVYDLIISRNLYASFVIGVLFRRSLIFETHQFELGFRRFMQISLIKCPWVTTIVISQALRQRLIEECGRASSRFFVLPDAAPAGIKKMLPSEKMGARGVLTEKIELDHYKALVGYFGHFYPGRGINIVISLAIRHPDIGFLLFGGNETEVNAFKVKNKIANLHVMGHIDPYRVFSAMGMMDVLLMPYQKKVSIGQKTEDTGRWMSPMKMFEYMASGVPIIASKLPILEEVLIDRYNCLMAVPDDPVDWSKCLNHLLNRPDFRESIGNQAHKDYKTFYTWTMRAQEMLNTLDL